MNLKTEMQFLPELGQKMVNHLETESQIKVRVPTKLKHNWEGVGLAVSRKLTRTKELVPPLSHLGCIID